MANSPSPRRIAPLGYSFLLLLVTVNLVGSIPIFLAFFFLKIDPGVKQATEFMLCFTCYTLFLFFTLLLGILAASSFRRRRLLITYLRLMSALFLASIAFLVFLNAVTTDAPPRYDDDHQNAREFSGWLREKVEDAVFWNKVKSGLIESALCKDAHTSGSEGAKKHNRLFGSCCVTCKRFNLNNVCPSWSRDPKKLCYDCELCKAAVLSQMNTKLSQVKQMVTLTMVVHVFTSVIVMLVLPSI